MPTISFRWLLCVFLASFFSSVVRSRIIGDHHRFPHHARQLDMPHYTILPLNITATQRPVPGANANAVIEDINQVQNGLGSLSTDLVDLLRGIEQRIQSLEEVLSSIQRPTPPTPPGWPVTYTASISTHYASLCRPPAGAGPLVPCPRTRTAPWNLTIPFTPGVTGSGTAATVTNTAAGTAPPTSTSPSPPMYTFNPDAPDNVAVYYGQSPNTQAGGLLALCQDVNVDIAILAFVSDYFGNGGYPNFNFGPECVTTLGPRGLLPCTALAAEIAGCQQLGKKVLISVGGYIANSAFDSDEQARQFAQTLWDVFGGATFSQNTEYRPFGHSVIVDGFDIDNENHDTSYYQAFASALRELFAQDESKTYYLSAAPQCPIPDESIPMEVMTQADFVWVQFYNNPQCNLDSEGFQESFAAWSEALKSASTTPRKPRLYIGAGAFEGAGSGYVLGSGLSTIVSLARELYVDNLGGIMLWDGSEGLANIDQYGVDYIQYAKSALEL